MFEEKIAEMNKQTEGAMSMIDDSEKRVYTVDEVQDILGISKTTAYHLVRSKVFHSVRVGGQYRISKKSFDKWLDAQSDCQMCD